MTRVELKLDARARNCWKNIFGMRWKFLILMRAQNVGCAHVSWFARTFLDLLIGSCWKFLRLHVGRLDAKLYVEAYVDALRDYVESKFLYQKLNTGHVCRNFT